MFRPITLAGETVDAGRQRGLASFESAAQSDDPDTWEHPTQLEYARRVAACRKLPIQHEQIGPAGNEGCDKVVLAVYFAHDLSPELLLEQEPQSRSHIVRIISQNCSHVDFLRHRRLARRGVRGGSLQDLTTG